VRFLPFWTPTRGDIVVFKAPPAAEEKCGASGASLFRPDWTSRCPLLAVRPARLVVNEEAATRRQLDRFAILTFVLATLWLFGIGSLLALYTGVLSLRQMRQHQQLRGRTVAWAGVAVAVFGVALAGFWIGLSMTA
jgi:hypothetical protein